MLECARRVPPPCPRGGRSERSLQGLHHESLLSDCCSRRETARQSKARLQQLDYRTTLQEFKKAEAARKEEAKRRAKLLQEARDREAAAHGWRE